MKPRSRISIFTGLVVLIITGASLRMIHIGTPSMWVDEANTVFSAGSVLETGMPYMPTGNIYGRAPLYTYSVALTYRILGVSLENARLTSAIFGILCIPLVYAIAALLFGRRIFSGAGLQPEAATWSYGLLTLVIILAPAVLDGDFGSAAGARFYDRLLMFLGATLYAIAALRAFEALWPGSRALATPAHGPPTADSAVS